jgi:hypothetical protein
LWALSPWALSPWALPSPSVASASEGGTFAFTEEAIARGVDYLVTQTQGAGRGVAFVDLDNDSDPDLVVTGDASGVVGVYENEGHGFFIDRSEGSDIPGLLSVSGVIAGDYDSDGDLDLYFSNYETADVIVRNDGGFRFVDVTLVAGLGDAGRGTGCAFGDYDNDGLLDLYQANLTSDKAAIPNHLYRNMGDGSFFNTGMATGETGNELTWQAVFLDYDLDGDADIYLSNDKGFGTDCGRHNYLFKNEGGVFIDITKSSGTMACIDSMGVALGDWDQNGYPDIYVTNIPLGNKLFLNNGDDTFTDFSAPAGVESYGYGWGALFFDFDNDAYEDLYVCNQDVGNRLYKFEGDWPVPDVAAALDALAPGVSYVVAAADIDDDGDLDLAVQNATEKVMLLINHHEQNGNHWAKFDVVGDGGNTFGIGAVVDVRTEAQWQQRHVLAGTNFKSQNDLTVHFGLRSESDIDEVRVLWPGGVSRTLGPLGVDVTWTLYPPSRLGDADGDGQVSTSDYAVLLGCVEEGVPATVVPGCEVMDFDGNGLIDSLDGAAFAEAWSGPGPVPNLAGVTSGIPALSDWGLLVMLLLVLSGGGVVFRSADERR